MRMLRHVQVDTRVQASTVQYTPVEADERCRGQETMISGLNDATSSVEVEPL